MGTYQAEARGQEEPGDLHQGPWPVANHVCHVVIETVGPCPGGCRESVRTGWGAADGFGEGLGCSVLPIPHTGVTLGEGLGCSVLPIPHRVGETGSAHRSDTRGGGGCPQQGAPSSPRASLASRLGMKTHVLTHGGCEPAGAQWPHRCLSHHRDRFGFK